MFNYQEFDVVSFYDYANPLVGNSGSFVCDAVLVEVSEGEEVISC